MFVGQQKSAMIKKKRRYQARTTLLTY